MRFQPLPDSLSSSRCHLPPVAVTVGAAAVLMLMGGCAASAETQPFRPTVTSHETDPSVDGPTAASTAGAEPRQSSSQSRASGQPDGDAGAPQRCRTSDLTLSVGIGAPGAGRQSFPLVLTNKSGATCTVQDDPGAEFQDSKNDPITAGPARTREARTVVLLHSGTSAVALLSFSAPSGSVPCP
ncbi:DUF4232 domain-containing protein [Streptomyces sp. NBC_01334]|uniref:DUF4232 domain-containing protein n=1 Tax=Streptomyces sp. NBC_01334 TaxID=2903827 RepID=UPI002E154DF2